MEKAFGELVESLLVQRKKCPWASGRNLAEQLPELESEVRELREAVEKNDFENMKEELGDVLWDVLFLGIIAEEKGLFSLKDTIEGAHAKLKRRKPWVFGNEKVSSKEEAVKRWNEIKLLEKKAKKK
jgi:NTP pyrophosphatase (non-canonical NTP hydrolase)